jgi:hypothetical protein
MNREININEIKKVQYKYIMGLQIKDEVKTITKGLNSSYQVEYEYIYKNKSYTLEEIFNLGLCYLYKQISPYNRFVINRDNINKFLEVQNI